MTALTDRLATGSAAFGKLTEADLPESWQRTVPLENEHRQFAAREMGLPPGDLVAVVVVELPDLPWAWHYQRWCQQTAVGGGLPTMVVPSSEYRGFCDDPEAAHAAAIACLNSILTTGKPAAHFARVFLPGYN